MQEQFDKFDRELDGLAPVKKCVSQIATLFVLDKIYFNLGFELAMSCRNVINVIDCAKMDSAICIFDKFVVRGK